MHLSRPQKKKLEAFQQYGIEIQSQTKAFWRKMLLCTSDLALISLILISQSKATFLSKEIRVWMSHLTSQVHNWQEDITVMGNRYFFMQSVCLNSVLASSYRVYEVQWRLTPVELKYREIHMFPFKMKENSIKFKFMTTESSSGHILMPCSEVSPCSNWIN